MEAPPPPPPLSTATVSPPSVPPNRPHSAAPDPPPPHKLRLMCSYNGHIIPRPHDKSLCYIGGDTRIIVIDRNTSLSDLHSRLSKTLINNSPFSIKYQLPNEDLDSLISITTEEDLENMVEEYDRLSCSAGGGGGVKSGRIRIFLFPQSSSIEQVLLESASTKSEDWFLNALNGGKSSGRGFSESSSVNNLLGLDDNFGGKSGEVLGEVETLTLTEGSKVNHDVHSVPDSPMPETSSSFGSTSSSPSTANLPPIKVHVEENSKVGELGIEGHFRQLGAVEVGGNVNLPEQKQEAGGFVAAGPMVSGFPVMVGGEYANQFFSDDERSDHGGYRKAQQIRQQANLQSQQILQFQQKHSGGAIELASPDSLSSEGSVTNPLSRQRQAIYQEPIIQIQSIENRTTTNPVDLKTGDQNTNRVHLQPQVQEPGYILSNQLDPNHPQLHQPQPFVHAGTQYIPAGAMPYPSYYPIYPSQQQQPMLNQQYPVYFMPARQAQPYPVQQPNYPELANSTSPQTPLPAYNLSRNAPSPQYVNYTHVHHPSQSMAPSATNYTYEFADPVNAQIYSTQPLPPQMSAVTAPEISSQFPTETGVRTLQQ